MLIALISLVIAASALVLILLTVLVIGIRQESPTAELSTRAPSPMSGLTRRLIGVYVRRPEPTSTTETRDPCLTAHATSDEGR